MLAKVWQIANEIKVWEALDMVLYDGKSSSCFGTMWDNIKDMSNYNLIERRIMANTTPRLYYYLTSITFSKKKF